MSSEGGSAVGSRHRQAQDFFRSYTDGLERGELRRLFGSDAASIYESFAQDLDAGPEPKDGLAKLLFRIRVVFLGVSYRLTPARRILFAASVFFTILGLIDFGAVFNIRDRIVIETSPLWFLLSVGGLGLILMLELIDQARVRDELEVAQALQEELLPSETPAIDGWEIGHAYETATAVGGDYYDFKKLDDGRWVILVGDASGHGMAAGLLMAIANAALGIAIERDPQPRAVLQLLNRTLTRTGGQRSFMTLFYALLDPESGLVRFASAGHPFPVLRRLDGSVEELGKGSLPLGVREVADFEEEETSIEPGDLLVLFSDGLPEAVNDADVDFGYERLHSIVRKGGAAPAVVQNCLRALEKHRSGRPLNDDFSLVSLARQPPLPPLPAAEQG